MNEPYFSIKTNYTITLNPSDKYQYFGKEQRLAKYNNQLYESFIGLGIDYYLVTELSEPHKFQIQGKKGPRLHSHGIIRFPTTKSLALFLMHGYYTLLRIYGIEIDTITDIETWYSYMTKQKLFKVYTVTISNYIDYKSFIQ